MDATPVPEGGKIEAPAALAHPLERPEAETFFWINRSGFHRELAVDFI